MATHLLIQKFSGMSRSSSLLGVNASAARAAAALEGVFHGGAVHPGMMASSKPAVHGYAARCFNVSPCSHADAKTSLTTTGMLSAVTKCMKPSFLDFSEGVKRTFSSSVSKSNNNKFTMEAKMAALRAQDAASKPFSVIEQVRKDVNTTIALMAFTSIGILYMSANVSTSTNNGSSHCSNCCNCQDRVQTLRFNKIRT